MANKQQTRNSENPEQVYPQTVELWKNPNGTYFFRGNITNPEQFEQASFDIGMRKQNDKGSVPSVARAESNEGGLAQEGAHQVGSAAAISNAQMLTFMKAVHSAYTNMPLTDFEPYRRDPKTPLMERNIDRELENTSEQFARYFLKNLGLNKSSLPATDIERTWADELNINLRDKSHNKGGLNEKIAAEFADLRDLAMATREKPNNTLENTWTEKIAPWFGASLSPGQATPNVGYGSLQAMTQEPKNEFKQPNNLNLTAQKQSEVAALHPTESNNLANNPAPQQPLHLAAQTLLQESIQQQQQQQQPSKVA